jgi:hypothetical protein
MTILVTGATGNIGRRIVDHLIGMGANDIRALTKNPARAKLPDSVAAVTGYLGDPESLPTALEGVERMYLAPLPETLEGTLELVKTANVEYVVALSGSGDWQEHADKITASGLVNTQLGPGEFTDNFTIWSEQIKKTHTVRDPYPSVVEAPMLVAIHVSQRKCEIVCETWIPMSRNRSRCRRGNVNREPFGRNG